MDTKATLGDIGRKESERLKVESNKLIGEIQDKDKKLIEELSVMLMSSGPIKVYDENGRIVAVALEFAVDRDRHVVELKARVLAESDLQAVQMMDNRAALIALIYNLTGRSPQDPVITSDRLTPDVIDRVSEVVAAELKISSDEALHTDRLRYLLELTSWKSAKAKTTTLPTQALTPTEGGFTIKPGVMKVEEPKVVETRPAEPETITRFKPQEITVPPQPQVAREKITEKAPEAARQAERPEKATAIAKKELQQEVESLKAMLDEDAVAKRLKREKSLENVDEKMLTEIDKAAEKLRQKMKSR